MEKGAARARAMRTETRNRTAQAVRTAGEEAHSQREAQHGRRGREELFGVPTALNESGAVSRPGHDSQITVTCLATPTTSRSGIASSRSGTALAPPPPPPCSPAEGLLACGDGSGSGATQTVFKCGRSAHIMGLWLPAASISCRLACISQCFGGGSAGLYAARRRELGLPGTSPVLEDPLQEQKPPSDALRSHGVTSRQRRFMRRASLHMILILCRHVARMSPLHGQVRFTRSGHALWPARATRSGRSAAQDAPQAWALRGPRMGPKSAGAVQEVARRARGRRFRVVGHISRPSSRCI